jgi:S-adenosylmethionine:tRNA ribosyltransferase-isomerase
MKLSHFQLIYLRELLAEFPSEHRDEARLMVIDRKKQTIEHNKDVIDYFDDVSCLNSFPHARQNRNSRSFLLKCRQRLWDVLVDPARK